MKYWPLPWVRLSPEVFYPCLSLWYSTTYCRWPTHNHEVQLSQEAAILHTVVCLSSSTREAPEKHDWAFMSCILSLFTTKAILWASDDFCIHSHSDKYSWMTHGLHNRRKTKRSTARWERDDEWLNPTLVIFRMSQSLAVCFHYVNAKNWPRSKTLWCDPSRLTQWQASVDSHSVVEEYPISTYLSVIRADDERWWDWKWFQNIIELQSCQSILRRKKSSK